MLASGSGPLGALLMIAPLAAIPVFAVVGIPQISPRVAAATDEEEVLHDYDSRPQSARAPQRKSRSADDLFAPVSPDPDSFDVPPSRRQPEGAGSASERRSDLRPHHRRQPTTATDPDDAWEVVPDPAESSDIPRGRDSRNRRTLPDSFDDPRASNPPRDRPRQPRDSRREIPASEGVPADEFDPDLLHSGVAAPRRERPAQPEPVSSGSRSERRSVRDAIPTAPGQPGDGDERGMANIQEQPRWQIASHRLKELGIQRYKLAWNFERQKFLFRCILPASDGSDVSDLFEADADTPLDAVEAVVQQIDDWLRSGASAGSFD